MFKKVGIFILIAMVLAVSFFEPIVGLAVEEEPYIPEPENGLYREGDIELDKSGEQIREEIDIETKEFDTHGLRDIKKGKKSFYDAYKTEFDEVEETVPGGQNYVNLIKDFDYHAGNFDCGKFNINCHITNFIFVFGSSIVNFLVAPLKKLAIEPEKILNDSTLIKFKNNFDTFTTSLLAVFLLFQIMKIYVFRFTSHTDTVSVINEKIIRVFFASILLFSYDLFFNLILQIQYRVNYGIFGYLSNTDEVTNNLMLNLVLTPSGTMFVIFVIIFALLLAVLFFQMTYTFALIALFYIVGPVAIVTMVNDEYNMFSMWLKTIISRFLTLALQGLCVILCFSFASKIDWIFEGGLGADDAFGKILAVSFLILGITLPGILKEFGSSSGSGRGAMRGAQSITRAITRK